MNLFKTREPRRYSRPSIYYNKHKEEVQRIHDDKLREMGDLPPRHLTAEDIRGTYYKSTKHLRKRIESGKTPMHPGLMILIVLGLLYLMYWLYTGRLDF